MAEATGREDRGSDIARASTGTGASAPSAGEGPLGSATTALLAAPVAVYALDGQGRVLFWNRAATALFGWGAGDVVGRRPPFVPLADEATARRHFDQILHGEAFLQVEGRARHRDGHDLDIVYSVATLAGAAGGAEVVLVFARDITAERAAHDNVEEAERKWRELATGAFGTIAFLDATGKVLSVTEEPRPMLGHDGEGWFGRSGFAILHPADVDGAIEQWAHLRAEPGAQVGGVFRARHADGHYVAMELVGVNLLDDDAVGAVVVAYRPASSARRTELLAGDEARILETIARDAPLDSILPLIATMVESHCGSGSGVFLVDEALTAVSLGAADDLAPEVVEAVLRLPVDAPGSGVNLLAPTREVLVIPDLERDPRTVAYADAFVRHGVRGAWAAPVVDTAAEQPFGFVVTLVPAPRAPDDHERSALDAAAHLAAIAIERDRWQRELERQARYDPLTELPNRAAVTELLDEALTGSRGGRGSVALAVIDIDRFKVVNDTLGHVVGDRLLAEFAGRLRDVAGLAASVGHIGADEFVVIIGAGGDAHAAEAVANRLAFSLQAPFVVDGEDVHLTASVGIACSPQGRENADRLLQQADTALARAKRLGRDRVQVFDEHMRTRSIERLQIDRDLRLAIERNELLLLYQPEIDMQTDRIVGVEALLRWQHPDKGLVPPDGFIEVAEDTGSIVAIGYWVIEEAIRQARAWSVALGQLDGFNISLNLSARQLRNRGLSDTVAFVLTRYDWPPSQLTLELTESILIEDRDATMETLHNLSQLGTKLAIDDFGTGFASLDYLHRLSVDVVKLDRSFVELLRADGSGSPVAAAMVRMAHAFGLITTAEGVETADQLAGLRALGYDLAQGFYFAHPVEADEITRRLRAQAEADGVALTGP